MKKILNKLILGVGTLGVILAGAAAFSAFEAHVINVTARIENALNVPVKFLDFGTVFPQEHLEKTIDVNLSASFLAENRVDDVEYFIRQKPKCAITTNNGGSFDNSVGPDGAHMYTRTAHVKFGDDPSTNEVVESYYWDCGEAPRVLAVDDTQTVNINEAESWGLLPNLCPYISKDGEKLDIDGPLSVDQVTKSFHTPFVVGTSTVSWLDTKGRLSKQDQDTQDKWVIDLAVPCFGGYCAQDWLDFVRRETGNLDTTLEQANAFTQPIENEHKVFGCDLWVEVAGISLPGGGLCSDQLDLALVIDRSGSISDTELNTMKTAAHAFVTALGLSDTGPHGAQVSFSTDATLDVQLTGSSTPLHTAIDALLAGGLTNLQQALDTASAELASARDRNDATSPDFIVLITDGQPTAGGDAAAAAAAAKAAGIKIYVVGVGVTAGTEDFLKNTVASAPSYYYSASDFTLLQSVLASLAVCENN